MKKPLIVLPFASLLLAVIVSYGFHMPVDNSIKDRKIKKGFAVVELFTSEGCSSCPPADEALAALAKDYPANVFVMGFHVDYWNYLGWKDAFSAAEYSKRQQQYGEAFQLQSIYTPQAIVNGKVQFTGSEKEKLYNVVDKELDAASSVSIELDAKKGSGNEVLINCKSNTGNKENLCIALVQVHATSSVQRGENKGLLLQHINVVRNFKVVNSNTASVNMIIPAGLNSKDCKVIAFVQNKSGMNITGAAETIIH